MKVLITGVNGFLGGYLASRLIKRGIEVHGLYLGDEKQKDDRIICHRGDLLDYEAMGEILKGINPDFIYHLAAKTEVEKSFYDPIQFSEVNYCGTVNLIEKAKDLTNLKLFVMASTMETYGWQPKPWKAFTEETEQHPNAPYAVAKIGCEKYLEYAGRAYKFPYTILRQTNTYGRWDNEFFVVEQIITQMLKNEDKINLGYREPYRNFLYIDDLIDLYEVILDNPDKARGQTFCCGPNNALTIEELVDKIAEILDWRGSVEWNTKPKRVGEIYYLNSSPAKAKRILGWEPKVSLTEGLKRTIKMWNK